MTQTQSTESPESAAAALYSICRHEILDDSCGIPIKSKEQTKQAIAALINDDRPPIAGVFGNGPLLVSNIPASSLGENAEVVLGIDEAGRGCVLGSMVYGCAYWSTKVDESIPKGFRDSKQMKEEERDKLFEELKGKPAQKLLWLSSIVFFLFSVITTSNSFSELYLQCDINPQSIPRLATRCVPFCHPRFLATCFENVLTFII